MKLHGYLHEVWLSPDDDGQLLPSCIALGPAGNGARNLNEKGSICVWVFWADTHFEAMNIYYEFVNYGTYKTDHKDDYNLYPKDWYDEQLQYISSL